MTGISKCSNKTCQLKLTCWRYLAPDSGANQSWIGHPEDERNECEDYWNAAPSKISRTIPQNPHVAFFESPEISYIKDY